MDNKRRLYRLIEGYLNEYKKDVVELFYGEGTYIKVNSITFGVTKNYILIDTIVKLGNTITEIKVLQIDEEPLVKSTELLKQVSPDEIKGTNNMIDRPARKMVKVGRVQRGNTRGQQCCQS